MHSLHNYDLSLSLQRAIPFADPNGYSPTMTTWPVGDVYEATRVGGFLYAAIVGSSPGILRKIDRATGATVLDITVGDDPRGVYYDGTYIFTANYNSAGTPVGNTVSVVDPATDTVVATVTVGSKPVWIRGDGIGSVWVACTGSTNAYVINATTFSVSTVSIGMGYGTVTFDNRAYMFFGSAGSTSLKRIRTTTKAITTFVMPHNVYGLCSSGPHVWATDFANHITRVDRMNLATATFTLPHSPTRRPSNDGARIWVPCGSSGYTVVVDAVTGAVVTSIHTGSASDRYVSFGDYEAYISTPVGLVELPLI